MRATQDSQTKKANKQTSNNSISPSKIIRWAGLSAIVTGAIFAGIQPVHPEDVISSVDTDIWVPITTLKTVMSLFGLFAIAGLYARQVKESGRLGLVGYLLLTIFYAIQMCYSFTEAFIFPHLVDTAPQFIEGTLGLASGAGGGIELGAFASLYSILSVFYLLGTLLFGIALFRARIMPRIASGLLAMTGPLALVMVAILPHHLERLAAVPMGIALIWLGYALWFERREKTYAN